jgi:hypothetical protein
MRTTTALMGVAIALLVAGCPEEEPDPEPQPTPEPTPWQWQDDGWRPEFEGSGGCPGAFHRDDDGDCVPDDQDRYDAEQDCWNGGQVNPEGIGRPCHPTERPCDDLEADCCFVDAKLYGATCVSVCETQQDCPEGSWCREARGICMRPDCEWLFDVWYPEHRYPYGQGFPCNVGSVNGSGVGTLCSFDGNECGGLQAAECLGLTTGYLEGDATSFCTMDCVADDDCGEGAGCVYENGPPFFCAPTSCVDWFADWIFKRVFTEHGECPAD